MPGPQMMLRVEGPSMGRVGRGMDMLPGALLAANRVNWERAGDLMFDASQEVVHVITGRLKRSGRVETSVEGATISTQVIYGGGEVDYAAYEHARGGTHAYLDRAFGAVVDGFPELLIEGWDAVVAPVLFGRG